MTNQLPSYAEMEPMTEHNPPPDQPQNGAPGAPTGPAMLAPLLAIDPPRVGDFWLDARLTASPSGVAYAAHGTDNTPAMVILLSEGAAQDAAARDRLAGTVNKMHIDTVLARGGHGQDEGRLAGRFRSEDDDPEGPEHEPLAPWVALAYDGTRRAVAEAERILAVVDLSWLPAQGAASGPDYRLHWIDKVQPGTSRLWPLPWPGRHDRAGWLSILASWIIMMLLMALAVLIAILLFQQSSSQQAPPPVPPTASSSASPSPQSGSPSPQSGSPSPQSGSPSPDSASPSPSSGGSPTPESKL